VHLKVLIPRTFSSATVEVEFILTDEMADRLLESLRHENVNGVYARLPAEFGVIGSHT
jgi:hypothetical protein